MRTKYKHPTNPRQIWVSLPKAARRLSLTGEQIIALIHSGELPGKLVGGGRWFVALADLDAFRVRRQRGAA